MVCITSCSKAVAHNKTCFGWFSLQDHAYKQFQRESPYPLRFTQWLLLRMYKLLN